MHFLLKWTEMDIWALIRALGLDIRALGLLFFRFLSSVKKNHKTKTKTKKKNPPNLSWRFNLTVKKPLWIKSLIWISKRIFPRDENFQRKQGWFDYKCTKLRIPSGVIILKMKMLPKQNSLYGSIFQHTLIGSSLQTKSLSTTNSYGIKEICWN